MGLVIIFSISFTKVVDQGWVIFPARIETTLMMLNTIDGSSDVSRIRQTGPNDRRGWHAHGPGVEVPGGDNITSIVPGRTDSTRTASTSTSMVGVSW